MGKDLILINGTLLSEAEALQKHLVKLRREIHGYAETGFELTKTASFVKKQLESYGFETKNVGKCGVVADLGNEKAKSTFLLRADMDALPIREETGLSFAAKNGNMHACGHDMNTVMLLGAAKLLKERESLLQHRVRLMFQPAEELLQGARDMIENGVLHHPNVCGAMMLHVLTGTALPSGAVVVSSSGESAPAADYFTITVQGKGCHGSMPQNGVDALSAAAHIYMALQEITAREVSLSQPAILTIGSLQAGEAANVIPDTARMQGTMRTFDENVRARLKKRIVEISRAVASAFRAKATITFDSGCPTLKNHESISRQAHSALSAVLGADKVFTSQELSGGNRVSGGGSEDFAYISQKVPSVMIALSAGSVKEGYAYPLHHPKADFDESVLYVGSAIYATVGLVLKNAL